MSVPSHAVGIWFLQKYNFRLSVKMVQMNQPQDKKRSAKLCKAYLEQQFLGLDVVHKTSVVFIYDSQLVATMKRRIRKFNISSSYAQKEDLSLK